MRTASRLMTIALLAALGLIATVPAFANDDRGTENLTFEVAENGLRWVFDEAPVFEEDGYPAYGNAFVTEGYIYEAGTLNGSNGVLPDGSPEFPDRLIGTWKCWGYMIGDGAHTTEGAWVVTTQLYDFSTHGTGTETLVTVGVESVAGESATRAVVGGTGRFATARGSLVQTVNGFNDTMGVVADFDVSLFGVAPQRTNTGADAPATSTRTVSSALAIA